MPKPNTSLSSLLHSWSTPATTTAAADAAAAAAAKKSSPEPDKSIKNVVSYLSDSGNFQETKQKCVFKKGNRFVHSCVARMGIDVGRETDINAENYLLAICNRDKKDYRLPLLDVTQILSLDRMARIFQSFGRLSLESRAEKFLLALKEYDVEPDDISGLIFSYATGIPNLTVEDVLLRFKNLHTGIEMTPSSRSYTKLVKHSCGLSEVQHIYSLICHYNLKPNYKTFMQLISLSVKMNDFDGAYGMLNDLKKLNLAPTTIMYNAIIGGYCREKRFSDVSKVLNQMKLAHVKLAHVKPDSITYSYLIDNCKSEEKVTEVLLYKGRMSTALLSTQVKHA